MHQEGFRLVLLPKMAFFALWDGVGAEYRVPRMPKPEVALPCGSQASAAKEGNGTSSVVDVDPNNGPPKLPSDSTLPVPSPSKLAWLPGPCAR